MTLIIRNSSDNDLAAITAIYDHAVRHGTGSLEITPPDIAEMTDRRTLILQEGYPYLVAEKDGVVVGYSYAGSYKKREGYRYTVENSIYVAADYQKQGIGHALLTQLISRCEKDNFRLILAVIGDANNLPSINLHKAHGFERTGILPSAGWKFDRWLDVLLMAKHLRQGTTTPTVSGS